MPGLPVKGSRQAGEQRVVGVSTAAEASLKLKRCIFMATIKGPGLVSLTTPDSKELRCQPF